MPRLNIEERFFGSARYRRLADVLNWRESEAAGTLAFLWFESQCEDKICGTEDEIVDWCRVSMTRPTDVKKIVPALIECGFISQVEGGLYRVHGNANQIEGRRERVSIAKKAANARWGKGDGNPAKEGEPHAKDSADPAKKIDNPNKGEVITAELPQGCETGDAEIPRIKSEQNQVDMLAPCINEKEQCHSIQCNAIQCNSMQGKLDSPGENPAPIADAQGPSPAAKIPKFWAIRISPEDRAIAQNWLDWSLEQTPKGKYNLEKFQESICKMRVNFDLTSTHIEQLFQYIKDDEFWKNNAISPSSLLKPSKREPEITKLEQVIRGLKGRKKTQDEKLQESLERQVMEGKKQENKACDDPFSIEFVTETAGEKP